MQPLLLCTDLDRTLLPNGAAPESPNARPLFRRLATHPAITLAFVTGRHRELVLEAMAEYDLPAPDFVIGDVGSTIYRLEGAHWQRWDRWQQLIARDWDRRQADELHPLLQDLPALRLQEAAKQNTYKLSYYAPLHSDVPALLRAVRARLEEQRIRANLIWSEDEIKQVGLLDILPAGADKLQAIGFLRTELGVSEDNTVFSGDSGNDLTVLASALPGTVVANASAAIQQRAQAAAAAAGTAERLYIATGDTALGLNGNYSAGIIEGMLHYHPRLRRELER